MIPLVFPVTSDFNLINLQHVFLVTQMNTITIALVTCVISPFLHVYHA